MISPQRRREVIDALRRGTVPQQGLDALAIGLDRIAPASDEELRFVATGSAEAYCVSVPDTAASAFVRNGLKHTICLQGELARTTELKNFQTEVGETLDRLQRDRLQQKFAAPSFTDPFAAASP